MIGGAVLTVTLLRSPHLPSSWWERKVWQEQPAWRPPGRTNSDLLATDTRLPGNLPYVLPSST